MCLLAKSLLQRLLGQGTAISAKRIDEGGVEGEPCGGGCRAVYGGCVGVAGECGCAVWLLACLPACLLAKWPTDSWQDSFQDLRPLA